MVKGKQLLMSMAVLGASFSAHAFVPDSVTAVPSVGVGAPAPFSGSHLGPVGTGFWDIFTFTLPVNGGSGYSVIDFPLTFPGFGTLSTTFSSMSLWSNPDGVVLNGDEEMKGSVSGVGPLSLTFGPSAGGNMYLSIMGFTAGSAGGAYNGAISVSAVPEAETWAMMAMGLGLVGLQLRRRKNAEMIA